jgi:hypothetical protein
MQNAYHHLPTINAEKLISNKCGTSYTVTSIKANQVHVQTSTEQIDEVEKGYFPISIQKKFLQYVGHSKLETLSLTCIAGD